jgi:hypothetical protein
MKFRKKPIVIEAEQWFPGKFVDGVKQIDPTIVFSEDKQHYYLSASGHSKDLKRVDAWLPCKQGGDILPFAFWKIKSGSKLPAPLYPDLVERYLKYMGWPHVPESYGIVETLEGNMSVSPGDWIITGVKGEKYPCKPDIFDATYEPVTS